MRVVYSEKKTTAFVLSMFCSFFSELENPKGFSVQENSDDVRNPMISEHPKIPMNFLDFLHAKVT